MLTVSPALTNCLVTATTSSVDSPATNRDTTSLVTGAFVIAPRMRALRDMRRSA